MVQHNKAVAIPKAVQRWIAQNLPLIKSGTKLQFNRPVHGEANYLCDSWRVMVNLRQLAGWIAYKPTAYPESVRAFIGSLPKNHNTWLVLRTGHVGTELENWRGFSPKKG